MDHQEGLARVIVGASSQDYPGWIRTQQHELDLTRRGDWAAMFPNETVAAVLAEHVWEHLTPDEARAAARNCFAALAPGGFVRCAAPDGLFPDPAYQRIVQVDGPGPADHPAASHKVVYDYRTLPLVFDTSDLMFGCSNGGTRRAGSTLSPGTSGPGSSTDRRGSTIATRTGGSASPP